MSRQCAAGGERADSYRVIAVDERKGCAMSAVVTITVDCVGCGALYTLSEPVGPDTVPERDWTVPPGATACVYCRGTDSVHAEVMERDERGEMTYYQLTVGADGMSWQAVAPSVDE